MVSNRLLANTRYDPPVQKRWYKMTFVNRRRLKRAQSVGDINSSKVTQHLLTSGATLVQWSFIKGGFTAQYLPSSLWWNSVLQLCLKFKGLFKWLVMKKRGKKWIRLNWKPNLSHTLFFCFFLFAVTRWWLHEPAFSLLHVLAKLSPNRINNHFFAFKVLHYTHFSSCGTPVESNRMTNEAGNRRWKRHVQPLCSRPRVQWGADSLSLQLTLVGCGYTMRWDVGRGHYLSSSELNVLHFTVQFDFKESLHWVFT